MCPVFTHTAPSVETTTTTATTTVTTMITTAITMASTPSATILTPFTPLLISPVSTETSSWWSILSLEALLRRQSLLHLFTYSSRAPSPLQQWSYRLTLRFPGGEGTWRELVLFYTPVSLLLWRALKQNLFIFVSLVLSILPGRINTTTKPNQRPCPVCMPSYLWVCFFPSP